MKTSLAASILKLGVPLRFGDRGGIAGFGESQSDPGGVAGRWIGSTDWADCGDVGRSESFGSGVEMASFSPSAKFDFDELGDGDRDAAFLRMMRPGGRSTGPSERSAKLLLAT